MTTELELAGYAPDHPAFAGHFPGNPIVPGVLLLDAALHALCEADGAMPVPLHVDGLKFSGVVRPGDALTLQVEARGAHAARWVLRQGARAVAGATFSTPAAPADADVTPGL